MYVLGYRVWYRTSYLLSHNQLELVQATVCCIHVCMGLDILINFGHGG